MATKPFAERLSRDDVLDRLAHSKLPAKQYRGLAQCGPQHCGLSACSDVCAYARSRRLDEQVPAAIQLLKAVGGPFFRLTLNRGLWQQPAGDLHKFSMAATRKFGRRMLDNLMMPDIAAVGMIKVAYREQGQGLWYPEIDQLIAGAEREDIERAFTIGSRSEQDLVVSIDHLDDSGAIVSQVMDQDVMLRQLPSEKGTPEWPSKNARREYYKWALGLRVSERIIRYGCDQHFNRLEKSPRLIRPKIKKPRPYPYWLVPYQFGSEWREMREHYKREEE